MDQFLVHHSKTEGLPATHALVIGVGAYPHLNGGAGTLTGDHEGMEQLTSPPISARRVAEWLIRWLTYPAKPLASVSLLLSEEPPQPFTNPATGADYPVALATGANVSDAIEAWKARGDEDADGRNRLLFYFCGHGISEGTAMALLLRDFGENDNNSLHGALDFGQLHLGMDRSKGRQQVFFVDACRATSDTLIQGLGHAGRVPIRPGRPPVGLGGRETPIYYSTLAGQEAYGRTGAPSPFTEALLVGLDGAGSDDAEGDWRVDTTQLKKAIDFFTNKALEAGAQLVQVPANGALSTFELHHLSCQPRVPVYVSCKPEEAQALALLRCITQGQPPTERLPAGEVWELRLTAGQYQFRAEFSDGSYRLTTVDAWVRPVYRRVPIEVGL